MKKASLVGLLLALCLSLAACELPFDLPFDLPLGDQNDNALYAMLEYEDYEAALKCITEAAKSPEENDITNTEALMAAYPELAALINERNYDGAYCHVLGLYHKSGRAMEKWFADVSDQADEIVFTDWYTTSLDNALPRDVTFRKDGTCSFMGNTYYWRATGAAGTADCMLPVFELHDGIQAKYRADFNYVDFADVYCVYLQDIPQSFYAMYLSDKQQTIDLAGTWLTLDTQGQVQKIEIAGQQIFLDGVAYAVSDCRFDVGHGDGWSGTHVMMVFGEGTEAGESYGAFNIRNVKGSMVASLYIHESHREVIFYKSGPDYDHAVIVSEYERALDVLSCLKGADNGLDYNGDERSYQEWLDYIYKAMVAADGYGESEKILSGFSVLEDMLVGVKNQNSNGAYEKEYRYDAAGRRIFANDHTLTKYIYGELDMLVLLPGTTDQYESVTPHYYFEYDDQGRVSRILHKNWEELFATITLTYDNRGNVKRLDILMADGQTRLADFTYEYDIMPRDVYDEWMEDEEIPESDDMNNVLRTVSYGDSFIDFAWTPDFDGYTYSGLSGFIRWGTEGISYSENVEYDDQGRVITRKIWINESMTVCTYTYDADGKLISEQHTTTDDAGNSRTITYVYIYQDILFYDYDAA